MPTLLAGTDISSLHSGVRPSLEADPPFNIKLSAAEPASKGALEGGGSPPSVQAKQERLSPAAAEALATPDTALADPQALLPLLSNLRPEVLVAYMHEFATVLTAFSVAGTAVVTSPGRSRMAAESDGAGDVPTANSSSATALPAEASGVKVSPESEEKTRDLAAFFAELSIGLQYLLGRLATTLRSNAIAEQMTLNQAAVNKIKQAAEEKRSAAFSRALTGIVASTVQFALSCYSLSQAAKAYSARTEANDSNIAVTKLGDAPPSSDLKSTQAVPTRMSKSEAHGEYLSQKSQVFNGLGNSLKEIINATGNYVASLQEYKADMLAAGQKKDEAGANMAAQLAEQAHTTEGETLNAAKQMLATFSAMLETLLKGDVTVYRA